MTTENNVEEIKDIIKKEKNPKRVAAGKKGIEVKKIKAEVRRKEVELMKKENLELKQLTNSEETPIIKQNSNKNLKYNILFLSIGVVGVAVYFYKSKNHIDTKVDTKEDIPLKNKTSVIQKKEIDPFEFN